MAHYPAKSRPVPIVLPAEDNDDEMHRRLDAIRLHYGAAWADLNAMRLVDLVGEDAVLGTAAEWGTKRSVLPRQTIVALSQDKGGEERGTSPAPSLRPQARAL